MIGLKHSWIRLACLALIAMGQRDMAIQVGITLFAVQIIYKLLGGPNEAGQLTAIVGSACL